ncbi:uridylate kinase [Cordyceps fumosorosea ARSEF 2679]|uniref:Uridylate kinase n=1 Tax=Cordyceps fumosorosea (strain ARSEF 2679) TaxID=1081104 RepID=A0A167ZGB0_CORFA|nr:uridylate kinase [Cordyceps fumosorosea ARSEF 2679]OAA67481.1 uridylate kinase [Cordyceps fumosorosea ARSEF 2679]
MSIRLPLGRLASRRLTTPQPISTATRPATLPRVLRQQQQRAYSSEPPRANNPNKVKFWPFFAIIGLGTAGYIALANRRKGTAPVPGGSQPNTPTASGAADAAGPVFSPKDVTVVFVLGGPGAGKGTQCARLVAEHGFTHLSAGDLLRAEQDRPGSQFGDLIRDYIKNGLIVPMEVTVKLLENAMADALRASGGRTGRFLIDGFPRKLDQAYKFEESVCPARLVLFFDCPEKVMEARLLDRGKTSGRADDNAESIRKRFRVFVETSMPVVDYYERQGKVVKVQAVSAPEEVFAETQKRLRERLGAGF